MRAAVTAYPMNSVRWTLFVCLALSAVLNLLVPPCGRRRRREHVGHLRRRRRRGGAAIQQLFVFEVIVMVFFTAEVTDARLQTPMAIIRDVFVLVDIAVARRRRAARRSNLRLLRLFRLARFLRLAGPLSSKEGGRRQLVRPTCVGRRQVVGRPLRRGAGALAAAAPQDLGVSLLVQCTLGLPLRARGGGRRPHSSSWRSSTWAAAARRRERGHRGGARRARRQRDQFAMHSSLGRGASPSSTPSGTRCGTRGCSKRMISGRRHGNEALLRSPPIVALPARGLLRRWLLSDGDR